MGCLERMDANLRLGGVDYSLPWVSGGIVNYVGCIYIWQYNALSIPLRSLHVTQGDVNLYSGF